MHIHDNIITTIGQTPLVRINNIYRREGVTLLAKVEGANPTGSIKDRIALRMLYQAEAEGALTKDKIIIEATSGNTGIGLAMIGAVLGYHVQIVMSAAVSVERRAMIKAYGGEVILTDPAEGTDGAIRECKRRVEEHPDKYFTTDQFTNKYNKLAHYYTTAEEIIADTEGKITHFVSAIGTSGTIMGIGKRLKEIDSRIKIVCAQPVKGHYIQGLKNLEEAIIPAIYDPSVIDDTVMIESEEAFSMSRRIIREEGIFVGMSAGAAMLASVETAKKIDKGVIVCIFPDRGEKYLSTKLFAEED